MKLKNRNIAFIGGGRITEIIIDNLINTETISANQIIISDPDKKRLKILSEKFAILKAKDNQDAVNRGDFIFTLLVLYKTQRYL